VEIGLKTKLTFIAIVVIHPHGLQQSSESDVLM
jgi:hypothetical protein